MKRLFLILAILALATPASGADRHLWWDAPEGPVTGYIGYYGTTDPPDIAIPATAPPILIQGLVEGQSYYFGVKSVNGNLQSPMSDVVKVPIEPESKTIEMPGMPKEIRIIFPDPKD